DLDPPHEREVDQEAVIHRGSPGDVVAASLDRDLEAVLPAEADGLDDVRGGATARDERRSLVDQAVVHPPGFLVAGGAGLQQLTRKTFREPGVDGRDRHGGPRWRTPEKGVGGSRSGTAADSMLRGR